MTLGNYPELGRKVVKQIPNAKLVEIEQCGHISHFEQPEKFHRGLLEFLGAEETQTARNPQGDDESLVLRQREEICHFCKSGNDQCFFGKLVLRATLSVVIPGTSRRKIQPHLSDE